MAKDKKARSLFWPHSRETLRETGRLIILQAMYWNFAFLKTDKVSDNETSWTEANWAYRVLDWYCRSPSLHATFTWEPGYCIPYWSHASVPPAPSNYRSSPWSLIFHYHYTKDERYKGQSHSQLTETLWETLQMHLQSTWRSRWKFAG